MGLKKGQSDVISVILILVVSISLVSIILIWGLPLIYGSQDKIRLQNAQAMFDPSDTSAASSSSLIGKIKSAIAQNSGSVTFTTPSSLKGLWEVSCDDLNDFYNQSKNYIQFSFFSTITDVPTDCGSITGVNGNKYSISCGWIPVNTFNNQTTGNFGPDAFAVVYERADAVANGYNISYRAWFRQLNESDYQFSRTVSLAASSSSGSCSPSSPFNPVRSTGGNIKISKGTAYNKQLQGGIRNLGITPINLQLY